MRNKLILLAALVIALMLVAPRFSAAAEKTKDDRIVKDGMLVSLEYTLKGTDGKLIESNKGKEPLKYIHGTKMMIPGLEKELAGMKVGGEKNVTVKPEDAYGLVNPQAYRELPMEQIPANGLKVGAILATKSPEGNIIPMRVHQIKEKSVVVDLNHPMAGRTLVFNIKVVDIQTPPPPPVATQSSKSAAPIKSADPAAPAKPATPAQPAKPGEPAK